MKARRFETLRVFLSPIAGRLRYARKAAAWRRRNPHNSTTVSEWCPIDKVTVGRESYGKLNVHWYGQEEESLTIGHYCSIAGEVHFILGGEHDYRRASTFPFREKIYREGVDGICRGPITVGDDVWIGFGAIVLSGVTIGQGSVIAAGSVVTKDVPPYSVWIGTGVRKQRFAPEIVEKLKTVDYAAVTPERCRKYAETAVTAENVDEIVAWLTGRENG